MECSICMKGGNVNENRKTCLDGSVSYHYKCRQCGVDNVELVDGFLYPWDRRSDLCSFFTPVIDFDNSCYAVGQILEIETKGGQRRKTKVLHIHDNKMITQDSSGKRKKRRVIINEQVIKDSYDCLYSSNKLAFGGWWNRKINII